MDTADYIIICDDEPDIRDLVAEYLGRHGFEVGQAGHGGELRELLSERPAAAVILDISMPGEDGLSIARDLRTKTDIAIVMLTASGETVDRIVGLEMGADDYLAKPVDLRELLARLRAVLRRAKAAAGDGHERATPDAEELVVFGDCRLDLESHKLFDGDGAEIQITAMEFNLLKVFGDHPNRVLNRDQLLELAHHRSWDPFDRSIDIRISRLRKKIERDPSKPQIIKTVRGIGYRYSPKGD